MRPNIETCTDIEVLRREAFRLTRVIEALVDTTERMEAAISKTLDDNTHLADGDNCTLIELKKVSNEQG